jgi:hypothetical protein
MASINVLFAHLATADLARSALPTAPVRGDRPTLRARLRTRRH